MYAIEDMNVCSIHFNNWGDEKDPTSNWGLAVNTDSACFTHRNACEFIFALSDDHINEYQQTRFSKDLIQAMREAQKKGYKYFCIYA